MHEHCEHRPTPRCQAQSICSQLLRTLLLAALACLPIASPAGNGYEAHPEAIRFADEMAQAHGLAAGDILATLGRIERNDRVIRLISPPSRPGVRSWARYRSRFIEPVRIEGGVAFWHTHADTLRRASDRYGVPESVIVAIIGVETIYGRHTGHFVAAEALATLAFDYPPRAELFRRELENLFLLARDSGRDPLSYEGSYAGALGFPQFLPSSIRNYAVDFDGDGRIDLENSPVDAIGSVAHYLAEHGWVAGAPVAVRAHIEDTTRAQALVDRGIEPSVPADALALYQVLPLGEVPDNALMTLVDLETPGAATEYWLGFRNFYVITRYNRSSFYAMAVFALSEALRTAQTETTVAGAQGR
nr:lytic murein transglycosylase B [Denitromonas iodatirespirans]